MDLRFQRLFWILAGVALCYSTYAGELRVGAAAVNINPPLGTPLAGYYSERGCNGVADDIFAKAALLDDGRTQVALVVCDLLTLPRSMVIEARKLIEQQTGIPGDHVMLSATHTHTAPVLLRESTVDEAMGANHPLCRDYTVALPRRIAQAVAQAKARLAPTRISFARETEPRLAFNRRFQMKDGTVGWNPGKTNPDILRPAGPIDPEVGVVYFETPDRKPQLTYVNYAMHPDTTGGTRVSADYPGALARRLADYRGPDMLTMFANGTCANLNHLNVNWTQPQQGTNEANRLGTILAGDVLKACMDLKPAAETTLRVRRETLQLPLAKVTEDDLHRAREIVQRGPAAKFLDRVQAYKTLDAEARQGKRWEVEVQVITLGKDVAWVGLPGEIFVELGLGIKAGSPFKLTLIAELANGSIGYIPNGPAYVEGNYEVVSARCAEGSGEMLVTSALKLLTETNE